MTPRTNEATPLLSSIAQGNSEANDLAPVITPEEDVHAVYNNHMSSPRASSVFSGSLASGANDAYEPEVNIDTLLVMTSGTTSLIPAEPSRRSSLLGLYSTVILFVARMVGSGIFATPGVIFGECQSSPVLFAIVWCLGALVGYSGLETYLELGSYLPVSGATKVFLEFIFPRPLHYWTVVFGTFTLLFTYCSTNAVVFGQYLRYSLGWKDDESQSKLIAICLILFGLLAHGVSRKFGILVQNAVGSAKILVLLIMLVTTVWILVIPSSLTKVEKQGWANYSLSHDLKALPSNLLSHGSLSVLTSAVLKSIYSFGGWTTAHTVQNEIKDPIRTIHKAAPLSFVSIFVLYAAMNLAYLAIIPHDLIAANGKLVGVVLFNKVFGDLLGKRVLSLIISLSAASNVLIVIFSDSRLYQEIAREGFVPFSKLLARNYSLTGSSKPSAPTCPATRRFSSHSSKSTNSNIRNHDTNNNNTPLAALIYHCTISILILVVPISKDIYSFVVSMTIYPNQLFHAILCLGVFKLRRRFRYIRAPLRARTPLVALCLVGSAAIVAAPVVEICTSADPARFRRAAFTFASVAVLVVASCYWAVIVKLVPWAWGKRLVRDVEITEDGRKIKVARYAVF